MKKIAIIPARGGSKRIPKKNIKNFLGKPIIAYSIQIALESELFDEVIVSTDSQEIADIAIKYGAVVPFLRSDKNSNDYATTTDVILEVLEEYKKKGQEYCYACCIYPTAPLITVESLIKSDKIINKNNIDLVLPVCSFNYPIWRSFKINNNGYLEMNWPENISTRSQDLPLSYHDCGQFYFFNVPEFLIQKKLFMNKIFPIIISNLEMQDIDSEEDWKIAELKYKLKFNIN